MSFKIFRVKLKSLFKRDIVFVIIDKERIIGIKNGRIFKRLWNSYLIQNKKRCEFNYD